MSVSYKKLTVDLSNQPWSDCICRTMFPFPLEKLNSFLINFSGIWNYSWCKWSNCINAATTAVTMCLSTSLFMREEETCQVSSEMLMELQTTERRAQTQISNGRSCDLCEPVFLRGTDDRTNDLSVVTQRVRGCDMTRSERQLEIPWYSQWSSHHTALYKEGKLLLYDRLKSWDPLKHYDYKETLYVIHRNRN